MSAKTSMILAALLGPLAGGAACVPPGNSTPSDAGATGKEAPVVKPSSNVMSTVFEDSFERANGSDAAPPATARFDLLPPIDASPDSSRATPLPLLAASATADAGPVFMDVLGPNWTQARTNAWRIEGGRLCGSGAKNHGVWLNRTLPVNARIEFDAIAENPDGDLKAEVWGDGQSAATTQSYTNATSYLTILGGWKNTYHVLARVNEHGADRKELKIDKESDDERLHPVVRGQVYRFKIERTDGKTVHWSVNGVEYLSYPDPSPLSGAGHDHFGFNDWEAKVCFDNVKVTPL